MPGPSTATGSGVRPRTSVGGGGARDRRLHARRDRHAPGDDRFPREEAGRWRRRAESVERPGSIRIAARRRAGPHTAAVRVTRSSRQSSHATCSGARTAARASRSKAIGSLALHAVARRPPWPPRAASAASTRATVSAFICTTARSTSLRVLGDHSADVLLVGRAFGARCPGADGRASCPASPPSAACGGIRAAAAACASRRSRAVARVASSRQESKCGQAPEDLENSLILC